MIKKPNIFFVLFIFLFGFASGAFLKHIKDARTIKFLHQEIEWLKNGSEFDAMMLEIYQERLFVKKDSIQ